MITPVRVKITVLARYLRNARVQGEWVAVRALGEDEGGGGEDGGRKKEREGEGGGGREKERERGGGLGVSHESETAKLT